MNVRITAELLRKLGACGDVKVFESLFPNGTEVTQELCVKHAGDFDWNWAADALLSGLAKAEYDKVRILAMAGYDEVSGPARVEYDEVCAVAFADAYLSDANKED